MCDRGTNEGDFGIEGGGRLWRCDGGVCRLQFRGLVEEGDARDFVEWNPARSHLEGSRMVKSVPSM